MKFWCFFSDEYLHWVARLQKSWQSVCPDLDLEFERYSTATGEDSWMRSCLRRPQMLIERWEDPGVGLLDADLEFRSRPSGFNDLLASHYDLATHVRMNMTDHSRYCAGVLWLAGETGKRVLYEWVDLCIIDPTPGLKLREQLYLHHAVAEVQPRILDLGESYNWVQPHGSTEQPPADVVIVHGDVQGPAHRATRTSRNPV